MICALCQKDVHPSLGDAAWCWSILNVLQIYLEAHGFDLQGLS